LNSILVIFKHSFVSISLLVDHLLNFHVKWIRLIITFHGVGVFLMVVLVYPFKIIIHCLSLGHPRSGSIFKFLGEGSYGTVHLAISTNTDSSSIGLMAIKSAVLEHSFSLMKDADIL
jgi:hypothetical protein